MEEGKYLWKIEDKSDYSIEECLLFKHAAWLIGASQQDKDIQNVFLNLFIFE